MSKIRDFTTSYNQKNILGPVNQSGGIPTGAIIESGSNSNGKYVKYADGTMISYITTSMSGGAAVAVGPFFRTTNGYSWIFPQAYSIAPNVQVTAYWTDAAVGDTVQTWPVFDRGPIPTTTQANRIRILSTASWSDLVYNISMIAIGRWF